MTPATIIKQANADGVMLALSPTGSIKAVGRVEAVNRWLPLIRQHKAELLDELRTANEGQFNAPPEAVQDQINAGKKRGTAEARRQRVMKMLADNPALRIAVVCDGEGDPVPVAIAIRGRATCEVLIPRDRYDGVLLLDLIEKHSATVH